jgi:hypothetical protein
MNKFEGIKFKTSPVKTAHGSKVIEGTAKGNFTREAIKKYAQTLADKLSTNGKKASVAVALHYKKSNKWAGGEFSSVDDDVIIYDPSDSVHGRIVKDDTINAIQIYVIKNK